MTFRPGMALACALGAIAGQRQAGPREPAWRHPHAFPRPGPDRVYFPPAPPRGAAAG